MASSASRRARSSQDGEGMDPLLFVGLFGVVLLMTFVLWSTFHAQISRVYGSYRLFTNAPWWFVGEYVGNIPYLVAPFHDWWFYWRHVDYSEVEIKSVLDSSMPINIFLMIAVSLPLAIRGIRWSSKTNPLNQNNFGRAKDYTVWSFMKAQEGLYPHLKLYGALNLLKQSINEGRMRMADTAKQFVLGHGLLSRECDKDTIRIDRDRALAAFRGQLGAYWHSVERLTPQQLVLFGAFAPKAAANDPKMTDAEYKAAIAASADLLARYWNVFTPDENGNVPSPRQLVANLVKSKVYKDAMASALKYSESKVVKEIVGKHAYVKTVLYELLDITNGARRTGVLESASFRWLKIIDRRLWYTMNNVGRAVAFPEVSGIYAHYLYEMRAGRAVEKPMVETAVDALQGAFDKLLFTTEEWTRIQGEWEKEDKAEEEVMRQTVAEVEPQDGEAEQAGEREYA
jgi:hypothetical protein